MTRVVFHQEHIVSLIFLIQSCMTHFFSAQLSKGGTSTSPDIVAPPPQPERPVTGNARARTSQSPRFELLEFLAKDIEQFDPDNCDNIDKYFRELDPSLKDGPKARKEEKTLRRVSKTSSTAVHKFLQSLPSSVTSNFHPRICTHISLMTQQGKHSLQKIRKMFAGGLGDCGHFKGCSRCNRACRIWHQAVKFIRPLKISPSAQNQGGEGSDQPHNQGRSRYPTTSQQRGGDWFTQNCPSRFP